MTDTTQLSQLASLVLPPSIMGQRRNSVAGLSEDTALSGRYLSDYAGGLSGGRLDGPAADAAEQKGGRASCLKR